MTYYGFDSTVRRRADVLRDEANELAETITAVATCTRLPSRQTLAAEVALGLPDEPHP